MRIRLVRHICLRYQILALVPAVALCLVPSFGCARSNTAEHPQIAATSYRGALEKRLLLTGELKSSDATEITVPRTPMWIVRISWMIEDGSEVKKGDKILEFDNGAFADNLDEKRIAVDRAVRNLEQEVARAEASLISVELRLEQARVAKAKAELDAAVPEALLSKKAHQDFQIAFQRTSVALEKAKEDMRAAQLTGETEVQVREVELAKIRREVTTAERAINDLVITAPEDGIITVADHPREDRKFKEGDSPWVGLTILRLPKLDQMDVQAQLFDVDDGLISAGQEVECTLDTYPKLSFKGVIRDITPIAQEAAPFSLRRAFNVNIDLKRTDTTRMRPGMSVRIDAESRTTDTFILAPRCALDIEETSARIHLEDGSWRDVEIGDCSAQMCIVTKGLDEAVALWRVKG